jgi:hypothetical protein
MNNLRRKTMRCIRCTLMALLPMYASTTVTAQEDVLQYVRPMMGTSLDGRIIPLAVAPFVNMITTNINGGALGMASAAGWILVLLILALTLMQMRMFKEGE